MRAGLEQSHLVDEPDFQAFRDHPRQIEVTDLQHVEAGDNHPNYWLVSVRFQGVPYARVAISDKGWLLSVQQLPSSEVEPRPNSWARDAARRLSIAPTNIRRVYFENTLPAAGSIFRPLFRLDLADGTRVFLADSGEAFAGARVPGGQVRLVPLH